MVVILLGPPGAGKGTQAARLVKEFDLVYLGTGDILRRAMRERTDLGIEAAGFVNKGQLVPDELVNDLVAEAFEKGPKKNGYLLDGYPRTINQAEVLEAYLGQMGVAPKVVELSVPSEEIIERLSGRRLCPQCGTVYHVDDFRTAALVCSKDGSGLIQRDDDKAEAVRVRLEAYERQTRPLTQFYKKLGVLRAIDGSRQPGEVFSTLCELIR